MIKKVVFAVAIIIGFSFQTADAGRLSRAFWTLAIAGGATYLAVYSIDSDHSMMTLEEKLAFAGSTGLVFVGLVELANASGKFAPVTISRQGVQFRPPRFNIKYDARLRTSSFRSKLIAVKF